MQEKKKLRGSLYPIPISTPCLNITLLLNRYLHINYSTICSQYNKCNINININININNKNRTSNTIVILGNISNHFNELIRVPYSYNGLRYLLGMCEYTQSNSKRLERRQWSTEIQIESIFLYFSKLSKNNKSKSGGAS